MAAPEDGFVQGIYEVRHSEMLDGAGGGLPAFAVRDHRHGRRDLMAVQVARDAPPRPLPLGALSGQHIANLLLPMAFGRGNTASGAVANFVIMPAPQGAAVLAPHASNAPRPWGERALIDLVLRPAAVALDLLALQGVTHRSIRGNNVFQARDGDAVTLGGAWAAPPGALQPPVFEPPYSAMCHPSGRGDGEIADDVYALGVLLISLALGGVPLAELDPAEVIRRKLERGSFAALVGGNRLPPGIADLARGMLAEDPAHRPPPLLLADPLAARSRRVAARPPQRAQMPLELDGITVWDSRMLAFAIFRAPAAGLRLLRGQDVDPWLRRALGDPLLAARVEEEVRAAKNPQNVDAASAEALLLLRCIALLDPLSPACWRGLALFPDGIGTLAAAAGAVGGNSEMREAIAAFIMADGAAGWASAQGERVDISVLRLDSRQNRMLMHSPGWAGGFDRLRYTLNPLLACGSALVGRACVVRLSEMLPALEQNADVRAEFVVDHDIAAFISARLKGRMDNDFAIIAQAEDPDIDPPGHRGLAHLRVLARLADHDPAQAWPHLAAIALRSAEPAITRWRSAGLRAQRLQQLRLAAERGALVAMLAIVEDRADLQADAEAARAAEAAIAMMDRTLHGLTVQRDVCRHMARVSAQEITAAIGVMALVCVAVAGAVHGS